MNRRICVITGTRAEYGLLYWLLKEIEVDPDLELQIVVTGMHLSPEYGLTYRMIEEDGFTIAKKIENLLSADTPSSITKAVGLGCLGFADAVEDLRPDIMVVLGDRFEILPPVLAALFAKIPVAHIHGGEITTGAFDEAIRHAISKMAAVHFPATERYAQRIIQLGEQPSRVFNFGMPGLDHLSRMDFMTLSELEDSLEFSLEGQVAIVTYHPVTLEDNTVSEQIANLLESIVDCGIKAIFTGANADTGGKIINQKIKEFAVENPEKYRFYDNLGQQRYLSLLRHLDLMIGNSSSGITEAPSFKLPVINIGDRQKGRVKAANIIDCAYQTQDIKQAVNKGLSPEFKSGLENMSNPYNKYGDGRCSWRIKETLKKLVIDEKLIKKEFYDLEDQWYKP